MNKCKHLSLMYNFKMSFNLDMYMCMYIVESNCYRYYVIGNFKQQ